MSKFFAFPRYTKKSVWGPCAEHEALQIARENKERYVWARGGYPNYEAYERAQKFGLRWIVIEVENDHNPNYTRFRDLCFPAQYRIPCNLFTEFLQHSYTNPREPFPGLEVILTVKGVEMVGPVQKDNVS